MMCVRLLLQLKAVHLQVEATLLSEANVKSRTLSLALIRKPTAPLLLRLLRLLLLPQGQGGPSS